MKKTAISMAMCASVLLCMTACQNEDEFACGGSGNGGSSVTLCASFENQSEGGTKTHLFRQEENEKVSWLVHWNEGDEIQVFDTDGNYAAHKTQTREEGFEEGAKAYFVISEGKVNGDFKIENASYAVYPYGGNDVTLSGNAVTINFPAVQKYVPDSFDNGANVSVGSVNKTDWSIYFKNAFGVLKLQLKGDFKVGKIKVTGHSDEKLNGKFNIDLTNINRIEEPKFQGAVATEERTSGDDVITLDCTGANNGGVQLNTERDTTFYIVVPVDAFKNGFSAMVYDAAGNHTFDVVATTKDNHIQRSKIKAMPAAVVNPAYQKVEYIKSPSDKLPYINTGYKPKSSDYTVGRMKWDDNVIPFNSFYGANPSIAFTSWYTGSGGYYMQRWDGIVGNSDYHSVQINIGKNKNDAFTVVQDANKFYFNDILQNTFEDKTWEAEHEALLFARSSSSGIVEEHVNSGSIFYFIIKNNGVLIRNYIPCYVATGKTGTDENGGKASAGTIGMLDMVTGRLYINRGSDSFTKGNDVSNGY